MAAAWLLVSPFALEYSESVLHWVVRPEDLRVVLGGDQSARTQRTRDAHERVLQGLAALEVILVVVCVRFKFTQGASVVIASYANA